MTTFLYSSEAAAEIALRDLRAAYPASRFAREGAEVVARPGLLMRIKRVIGL